MMAVKTQARNLTIEQSIVWHISTPEARPGHSLVVYEDSPKGRRFFRVVPPGQYFRRPIWGFAKRYSAFLTTADPHLKLISTRDCKTRDQLHAFTLTISISYKIKVPELLIDRLDQDPLSRIQQFAEDLVTWELASLEWFAIKTGAAEFYDIASRHSADGREPRACFSRLYHFAMDYGVEVLHLGIDRSLPDGETVVERRFKEVENERGILRAQSTLDFEKQKHQQSMQMCSVIDDVVKSINDMLVRAGQKVDSYPEMKRALQELAQIRDMTGHLVASADRGHGELGDGGHRLGGARLLTGAIGAEDCIGRLLAELCSQLVGVKAPLRFKLTSDCLHLVAECLLGGAASSQTVGAYCSELADALEEFEDYSLDRDQIDFLRQLMDTPTLTRDLRGES